MPRFRTNVVTGVFAFGAKLPADDPKQRIEPVQGSRQLCQHLYEPIEALDVGEFVSQDDTQAIVGPIVRDAGKQNAGA
jgi:hypothetical protein